MFVVVLAWVAIDLLVRRAAGAAHARRREPSDEAAPESRRFRIAVRGTGVGVPPFPADLHVPVPTPQEPMSVVVFGPGMLMQPSYYESTIGTLAARAGVVVVVPGAYTDEVRGASEDSLRMAGDSLVACAEFVWDAASRGDGNPLSGLSVLRRVVLAGHSAGGELALWAAARGEAVWGRGVVRGVISFGAACRRITDCPQALRLPAAPPRVAGDFAHSMIVGVPVVIVGGEVDELAPPVNQAVAYDALTNAPRVLLVISRGTHCFVEVPIVSQCAPRVDAQSQVQMLRHMRHLLNAFSRCALRDDAESCDDVWDAGLLSFARDAAVALRVEPLAELALLDETREVRLRDSRERRVDPRPEVYALSVRGACAGAAGVDPDVVALLAGEASTSALTDKTARGRASGPLVVSARSTHGVTVSAESSQILSCDGPGQPDEAVVDLPSTSTI